MSLEQRCRGTFCLDDGPQSVIKQRVAAAGQIAAVIELLFGLGDSRVVFGPALGLDELHYSVDFCFIDEGTVDACDI